jgi:hypothetical protein
MNESAQNDQFHRRFDVLMRNVFVAFQPSREYYPTNGNRIKVPSEEISILDASDVKLSTPLLNVDIESIIDQLLDASQKPPGTREKELLSVMKGMGGGKTRLLVECQLTALNHKESLNHNYFTFVSSISTKCN